MCAARPALAGYLEDRLPRGRGGDAVSDTSGWPRGQSRGNASTGCSPLSPTFRSTWPPRCGCTSLEMARNCRGSRNRHESSAWLIGPCITVTSARIGPGSATCWCRRVRSRRSAGSWWRPVPLGCLKSCRIRAGYVWLDDPTGSTPGRCPSDWRSLARSRAASAKHPCRRCVPAIVRIATHEARSATRVSPRCSSTTPPIDAIVTGPL